jgi:predicted TIM-barrel fold metal-dependent hydrolase
MVGVYYTAPMRHSRRPAFAHALRRGRREFIRDAIAVAVAAGTARSLVAAQARGRIDVHHHFIPPRHLEAVLSQRESGRTPPWSPEFAIEEMDRNGVATSICSLVQPGVWLGDVQKSRTLARECNEYGARMVTDRPGRFGYFAAIPLPDTDGSLREIEAALDTLKADGIGLMTSFGDKYLGDPAFAPVYEELNRRRAVVYVHPTQPGCCTGLVPGVTVSTIEYATDSSRTIASLVFSGTAAKYPDIRWIFSHGGGTVPFLVGRFERLAAERKDPYLAGGSLPHLRRFFYETAQANHKGALDALLAIIPASNVLFGSDYPLRPVSENVEGLAAYGFTAAQRNAIDRENAQRLMPRLRP